MADGRHLKLKAINSEYLSNCRVVAGKHGMMTTLAQQTLLCHPIHYAYYFVHKTAKIIKQKLASVSLLCKTAAFKQQISKFYAQILRIEASFYIYDRPLTEKMR